MDLFNYFSNNPYLFLSVIIISLILKGFALWRASKNDHALWFIVILVINTLGILDILYLFYFSQKDFTQKIDRKILNLRK